MVFTPLLARRRAARRTRADGLRRPPFRRPLLEILEDRLAPGDTVLGGLLAGVFTGPSLDPWDPIPLLKGFLGAGPAAQHRPFDLEFRSVLEDDHSPFSTTFAIGPVPADQPSRQDSTPDGGVTARETEPGWDALSPVFPADDSSRLVVLAGSPGFNATAIAGNSSASGGV